jgi:hypothetical protein
MRANTRGTFPDALLDPSEQLVEKCPEGLSWSESEAVPVKVWEREETSIRSVARAIVKYEFTIDDRKHIVVDENSFQHYHNFVSKVLGTYNDCLQKLLQKRQKKAAGGLELKEASELLTKLNKAGKILCDLAHRSPSFRRYISTNAVAKRIKSIAYNHGGELATVLLLQAKTSQS